MLNKNLYLSSLVLVMVAFINFSCAPTVVTTTGGDDDGGTTYISDNIKLVSHDKDCIITDTISAVAKQNYARALFFILGDQARSAYYSFGYKILSGPTPSFVTQHLSGVSTKEGSTTYMIRGKMTLTSPAAGTYSYQIVLRDVQKCHDVKGDSHASCSLSDSQVKGTNSSYDTVKNITFDISEDNSVSKVLGPQLLSAALGGTCSAFITNDTLKNACTKLSDGLKDIGTEESTPLDPSAVENGCTEGWPTK